MDGHPGAPGNRIHSPEDHCPLGVGGKGERLTALDDSLGGDPTAVPDEVESQPVVYEQVS
jgi:hypothetical protein